MNVKKLASEYDLKKRQELAVRMRNIRVTLLLSQREMSIKSGLHRNVISRIENAETVTGRSERVYFFHLNYELEKLKNNG